MPPSVYRDFATISYGTTTHRICFADRDMLVGGQIYTAIAATYGEIGVQATGQQKECTITMPIDHAFVRRYVQLGIPPGRITCTISRQLDDDSIEQRWSGEIMDVSIDSECVEATFRVVSQLGRIGAIPTPTIPVQRNCPYTLFEGMCGRELSRDGTNPDGIPYKLTTTVLTVSGRDVRIDLTNVPAANARRALWCVGGEFIHATSGERRTVRWQADESPGSGTLTRLTLYVPIVGLRVGDSIDVYPGCDKGLRTLHGCGPKFGNRHNYGGLPQLPAANPFIPGGPGVEGLK